MTQQSDVEEAGASASNFIRSIIASDVEAGRTRIVVTRFPPEPNGYLHLGHAKSIVLNYELAKEFGGRCNLRLDDTNPAKERVEYIDAIKRDVQWLGFDWAQGLRFASDYFEQLYAWACHLVHIATIAEIETSGLWPPSSVVAEMNPEERFWQAEPEHQDYLQRHPGGYSCHFIRPSWRLPSAHSFQKSRTAEGPQN